MENFELEEDPVIREIRDIREEISQITAGFSDEELLAWYKKEAQEALTLGSSYVVGRTRPTTSGD